MNEILSKIYYDVSNPAGYSSVDKLYSAARKELPTLRLKQVKDWLRDQETYTLHNKARKRYPRRKTLSRGIDDVWQMDLCDLSSISRYNNGYKFLLTGIDVFSRYAFVRPLKNKSGIEVTKALKDIFEKENRSPQKLGVDMGTEFYNRNVKSLLDSHDIKLYSVYSIVKMGVIERFNRTLKSKMFKYFTKHNTRRYIDVLQNLVDSYNKSKHRTIQLAPAQVDKSKEKVLWKKLYKNEFVKSVKYRFKVGDYVRISKIKKTFEKGFLPNWTKEYFIIADRLATKPPTYKVKDFQGELIKGRFYEPELQLVTKPTPDAPYQVDVLQTKKIRKKTMYLVHFRGWPSSFDEWISEEQLTDI